MTDNTTTFLPNQYVSESKKQEAKFNRDTINYYINISNSSNYISYIERVTNIINGNLNREDYNYVLNPYNSTDSRLLNFPAELRNYDIINPIIRRYCGEFMTGFRNWTVVVQPQGNDTKLKSEISQKVKSVLAQMFVNALNQQGIQTNVESKDVPELEEIAKNTTTWNEQQEEFGQDALDFLYYNLNCETEYSKAWYYWITYGLCITYKKVYRDTVKMEIIPPTEYYPIDNGKDYIEDNDAGIRKYKMSIDQVMSEFRDDLHEADIEYLQNLIDKNRFGVTAITSELSLIQLRNGKLGYDFNNTNANDENGNPISYNITDGNRMIDVYHVTYKSPDEIGILQRYNAFGEIEELEVESDYKLNKENGDIKITYEYIPKVREAYRLGDEFTGIYVKSHHILVDRTELNNSAVNKLQYNGKIGMFNNAPNHSIVLSLLSYQCVYNIYHYQRELTIGKWIGNILTLPKGLLKQNDISEEEEIYHIKAENIIYVDETDEKYQDILNGIKSFNIGDYNFIQGMGEILQEIKSEAWEAVDMNRQRYGDTYTKDGKGVTEQAIARASIGSVPINEFFNKFLEKEYEGLLDCSKYAWINATPDKPQGNYINSQGKIANLIVNSMNHLGNSYGIFIKNSKLEEEKIAKFQQWAFNLSQNGNTELAAEAIENRNSTRLKNIILKATELNRQREEQLATKKEEINNQTAQIIEQGKEKDRQKDLVIADATIKKDVYLGELNITNKINPDGKSNVDKSLVELNKLTLQERTVNQNDEKNQIAKDSNSIKREKIKSDEKIAKMNKN